MDMIFAEARSASKASSFEPSHAAAPQQPVHVEGVSHDDLMDAIPSLLGIDELQDENDVLYIANTALESGVHSLADMLKWLDRQEMLAKMSKEWDDGQGGRYPTAPRGKQIANYLRRNEHLRARHG